MIGQETAVNNESTKRQRRWNTEGLKVIEPQSVNISPSTTTPKGVFQPIGKRSFSRSDSMASVEAPKERVGEFSCFFLFKLLNYPAHATRMQFSIHLNWKDS